MGFGGIYPKNTGILWDRRSRSTRVDVPDEGVDDEAVVLAGDAEEGTRRHLDHMRADGGERDPDGAL